MQHSQRRNNVLVHGYAEGSHDSKQGNDVGKHGSTAPTTLGLRRRSETPWPTASTRDSTVSGDDYMPLALTIWSLLSKLPVPRMLRSHDNESYDPAGAMTDVWRIHRLSDCVLARAIGSCM
ncbi:hypothetical protein J1614_006824 [Plenodomus biglobosus]|nr:hypothetical protein J1614_006824 [Plenodomus biglobosus]